MSQLDTSQTDQPDQPGQPRRSGLQDLIFHGVLFVGGSAAALLFDALDDTLNWFYFLVVIWLVILVLHTFIVFGADRLVARRDPLSQAAVDRTERFANEDANAKPLPDLNDDSTAPNADSDAAAASTSEEQSA